MITIKKNKKLDLKIPEFLSEDVLPHLKTNPMMNNLNGYYFTAIIGKPGSGKTSFLISLLTGKKENKVFRKSFDHILLVMPTSSRESMKRNIFKSHDEDKMYDELTYSTITSIHNKLLMSTKEKETTLLILDDVGASLKNAEIATILRKIIYNRRHLKVHIVIMIQSYLSMPKEVRKLFSNIVMFKPSKVEMENLMSECFEIKRDEALELMQYAFIDPHDYLFLNIDTQRMYKDYDEIIIEEK